MHDGLCLTSRDRLSAVGTSLLARTIARKSDCLKQQGSSTEQDQSAARLQFDRLAKIRAPDRSRTAVTIRPPPSAVLQRVQWISPPTPVPRPAISKNAP